MQRLEVCKANLLSNFSLKMALQQQQQQEAEEEEMSD